MGWTSKASISETGRLHCDIPRCTKADTGWLKGSIIFYKAGRSRKHCRAESMLGKSEKREEKQPITWSSCMTRAGAARRHTAHHLSEITAATLELIWDWSRSQFVFVNPKHQAGGGEARVSLTFDLRGRLRVNAGYSSVIRDFIRYYLSCPAARPPSQSSS